MFPLSLAMGRQKPDDRGHPIPLPGWWLEAMSEIRDAAGGDAAVAKLIARQTGRSYSKYQLSRYFNNTSTTLELTRDLWLTYRAAHSLPRPFFIPETREEAEAVSMVLGDYQGPNLYPAEEAIAALDAEIDEITAGVPGISKGSQSGVLPIKGEQPGQKRSRPGLGGRGRASP